MNNVAQSFYAWYKETLRNTKYRWLLIGGTLLYLVSPIDIAPDFIPIIGWIDDAAIATLLAAELSQWLLDFLNKRKGNLKTETGAAADADVITIDAE
jgi:uncharacterized membrane protein YkvA (DUF1232 family)